MYSFVVAQGILHENQFGLRQSHSTSHALNYTVTKISEKIKCGESVIGIFIDLRKAFDTIDHQKLLYKLEYYGIRGIAGDLIKSYLINRQQYTETVGEKSKCLKVLFDVPQSSALGPLLFLLYTSLNPQNLRNIIKKVEKISIIQILMTNLSVKTTV